MSLVKEDHRSDSSPHLRNLFIVGQWTYSLRILNHWPQQLPQIKMLLVYGRDWKRKPNIVFTRYKIKLLYFLLVDMYLCDLCCCFLAEHGWTLNVICSVCQYFLQYAFLFQTCFMGLFIFFMLFKSPDDTVSSVNVCKLLILEWKIRTISYVKSSCKVFCFLEHGGNENYTV